MLKCATPPLQGCARSANLTPCGIKRSLCLIQWPLEILATALPDDLLEELLKQHTRSHHRSNAGDAEGCLEALGKFAECAIRCNQLLVTGHYTPMTTRLKAFDREVVAIEGTAAGAAPEDLRVIAPRVLLALYTIRNKRRGGHVASEISPQRIDARLSLLMADWLLAELTLVVSGLPLEEGQALVDAVVQRSIPAVFSDEHAQVVLRTGLAVKDEILLLAYSVPEGQTETALVDSTRAPRSTVQRTIAKLEESRLVYRTAERPYRVRLLPSGARWIEKSDLLKDVD